MKDTINGLLKLRDIDEKLDHLARRIEEGPRILGQREREYRDAEAAVEVKREAIIAMKLESKDKEVGLKGVEEEIKKQEGYLLGAKTNQEYNTIRDQIQRLRDEVSGLEEAILGSFDAVEAETQDLNALERELEMQKKELAEFKGEVENDHDEYSREIDAYNAKRGELVDVLNFDAVRTYNKVKNARDGSAVVSADGRTCGGCFMTVTANDIARLRGMSELVMCKSCQRILYLSDML